MGGLRVVFFRLVRLNTPPASRRRHLGLNLERLPFTDVVIQVTSTSCLASATVRIGGDLPLWHPFRRTRILFIAPLTIACVGNEAGYFARATHASSRDRCRPPSHTDEEYWSGLLNSGSSRFTATLHRSYACPTKRVYTHPAERATCEARREFRDGRRGKNDPLAPIVVDKPQRTQAEIG